MGKQEKAIVEAKMGVKFSFKITKKKNSVVYSPIRFYSNSVSI